MRFFGITLLIVTTFLSAYRACAQDIPRPEHPRPQMVRGEWLNLNGDWEFGETNENEDARFLGAAAYPETIRVPFCREAPLSGIERRDFVKNVWYRRTFTVPAGWTSPRIRLHINACDFETRVWVNGALAGTHEGGNAAFNFDVTRLIQRDGENTVIVHAFDDTGSGNQPLGKQSIRDGESFGIFYTPTTGIWQTVWLEGVGETFIDAFRVNPDPKRGQAGLEVDLDGPSRGLTLEAEALLDGETVGLDTMEVDWRDNRLLLTLSNVMPWSPASPMLYDLKLTLKRGDEVVDQVASYFGLRRVTVEGMAILINGEAIFQRLVLDQGFYPDGVWTAPTDEALKHDIELSMKAGFNGARLHQKVFEPRFHYWADKLGYLTWGEYPSYGANYANPAVNEPYINEWNALVARDFNHPSIIGWCAFNETPPEAGKLQRAIVDLNRKLDPSRPSIDTSGWTHAIPDPEVLDAHNYDQDPASFRHTWNDGFVASLGLDLPERYGVQARPTVPFMISEYGGIGWSLDPDAWGYGNTPATVDEYYARFKGLSEALLDNRYLFGLCYTQLTDIEQEQNGVYNYDRSEKFSVAPLHEVLSRPAAYEQHPPVDVTVAPVTWKVLVGAQPDGALSRDWQYTTETPGDTWKTPDFDDSAWKTGRAPFGYKGGDVMELIRTKWRGDDLWVRQRFEYDGGVFARAALVMHHDDEVEVYVNGKEIFTRGRWNDRLEAFDVTSTLRNALKSGQNTIAVHILQDRGGQYLDLALLVGRE